MSKAALYQKIVKVMNEVGQLVKDGTVFNEKTNKKVYSYLSEEQTTAELQSAFIKHGIVLFPIKVESELIYLESFKYNESVKAPITKVIVTYKLCDADTGEFEELQSIGYGSDSQDKGSNKAMTGAFKYVQRQTFMISTGDDGDHTGNSALDEQYKQPVQPKTNPTPPTPDVPTSHGNNSGQQPAVGTDPSKRVYGLMNSMQWSFDDLSRFASEWFGKEVKNLKNQLKSADEWNSLYNALNHYNNTGQMPQKAG